MKNVPIDELVFIENKLGIPVHSTITLRETADSLCWNSLLSTQEKRLQFRAKQMEVKGHQVNVAGCGGAHYIFNPDGYYNVFEIINESVSLFASKLKLPVAYRPKDCKGQEIAVLKVNSTDWNNIPNSVAQSMLEEMEQKLAVAPVSIVVFNDFLNAPSIIRSFAVTLFGNTNIGVFLTTDTKLSLGEDDQISQFISNDSQLLQSARTSILEPSKESIKRVISEHSGSEV
ncbi:hypothetical protein BCT01_08635 [Vibrio tasmaniensis]|uniref:hypothetical protein n=1 Tax=Vibrio TaxID=662 RepID=UPI000C83DB8C|nr:hypothetical protein [Vibrio tasmaniensis]PMO80348.1 hypothetical protein BCT01_08635 [Vibrio tasmaniensis]